MSTGSESSPQRLGGGKTPVSVDSSPDLEVVREVIPLAVRPLNAVAPTQQFTATAREAGPVVPAIRTDDSESTEEDVALRVTLAERSSGAHRVERPIPQLRDEEDEEEEVVGEVGETAEENTGEEGGEGETQETGETEEMGEAEQAGPSSVVARRRKRKENPVVINALNIAVRGEDSYLASTMTAEDVAPPISDPGVMPRIRTRGSTT